MNAETPLSAQLDHLVVFARNLADGVAWCEATLGVVPSSGGEHPLFGTHNRLINIASSRYPRAYLEIIAINPAAPLEGRRSGKRWFDMDDPALQDRVADEPRLVHFVAQTPNIRAALAAWHALGIDRGPALQASRMTASELLEWQISVRPDGQRLMGGTLPTLIEWGAAHPTDALPQLGVSLQRLEVRHPRALALQSAYEAVGFMHVQVHQGPVNLAATLQTPKGQVRL